MKVFFFVFPPKTRNFARPERKESCMILKRISILNYKNIASADVTLSSKLNCLIGSNGVGKTNFLDAVYMLSFCKSAFCSIDSQLIRHDEDFMVVQGHYLDDGGDETEVYCGMKRGQKKHFKREKKEYRRLSEHLGLIPLVFVSPSDSSLIDGASEGRRKLMDVVISQYDRDYITALQRYGKALQQRNVMLRAEEEPDSSLLELLEMQMGDAGEAIYRARAAFIDRLVPVFQETYQSIAQGKEEVSLRYVSHCQRGPLFDVIRRDRMKDRAVGYSLHGVHRDDLEMLVGGYPLRREGSQGQSKTFVLALRLAQFACLKTVGHKRVPLLLLDDIFDKLDAQRVEQIVKLVSGDGYGQIVITDTNRDHLDQILAATDCEYKLFNMEDGTISEKEAHRI